MTDQKRKWPESLPPPFEVTQGPSRVHLTPGDLVREGAIQDLVHDLYWFPDDEYFLFFVYGQGIGRQLNQALEEIGVEMKKTEMYFYRHPKPAYENDFISVMPRTDVPEWQQEAAGQMYGRVSLALQAAVRKQIDFDQAARRTRDAIADGESVVEAKPNVFGMGLNLNSLWRKATKWFRKKLGG